MTQVTELDLLMVGHFAKDLIVVDGQSQVSSGGGVYYGAVGVARLGMRVGVATRLHQADFDRLQVVRQAGVVVHAVPGPATSGIENVYQSTDMERRKTRPIGFAGPFELSDIPDWSARTIALVPIIAGEIDLELLTTLSARSPLALDVQGFVRVRQGDALVFRPWGDMDRGLARVTYLKADRAEAELMTGETDLIQAAALLTEKGPSEIMLTESRGVTVYAQGRVHFAPFRSRSQAGRTGRGDACFSTYLAMRLDHSPQEAVRWAAAVTSLKMEKPGPWDGDLTTMKAWLKELPASAG